MLLKTFIRKTMIQVATKLYPRNTTVIVGDSSGVFEDRLRRKNHAVKVRNFPGAHVEDM